MKYLVIASICILFVVVASVEGNHWCNETKSHIKEEIVSIEEVTTKKKNSVMCRLRKYKPESCTIKVKITKHVPKYTNITTMIPKCCEGYKLAPHHRCIPICTIECPSGVCSSPNVCYQSTTDFEEPTTPETDYYDEEPETSTSEQEMTINVEIITEVPFEDEVESTVTTSGEEGSGELPTTEESPDSSSESDKQTQSLLNNWIVWISVSFLGISACVLGYFGFVKLKNGKKASEHGQLPQVVSYSK